MIPCSQQARFFAIQQDFISAVVTEPFEKEKQLKSKN